MENNTNKVRIPAGPRKIYANSNKKGGKMPGIVYAGTDFVAPEDTTVIASVDEKGRRTLTQDKAPVEQLNDDELLVKLSSGNEVWRRFEQAAVAPSENTSEEPVAEFQVAVAQ